MHLSKNQIWALFIVLLMAASTIGFLYRDDSTDSGSELPPADIQTPTVLNYEASGVSSKVLEVFPIAILIAKSADFEVSEANRKLLAIDGIESIQSSEFVNLSGREENFRAQIRLSDPSVAEAVVQNITDSNSFGSPQLFLQALVSVPEKVEFKNAGLGLSQEYTFADPQLQGFVNVATRKGDELIVSLSAVFQGQAFGWATAFEEQNLTATSQVYFASGDYAISSFENEFLVRSNSDYSSKSVLENAKASFDGSFDSQVLVQPVSTDLTINFVDANSFAGEDLNAFLADYNGVSNYALALANNSATITFDSGVDFPPFKQKLNEGLDSLGFIVGSIAEPKVLLYGTVKADSADSFFEKISELETGSMSFEVSRKIMVDADTIFIPDLNESLPVPGGSFSAFVKPVRQEGEVVSLDIVVIASQRDGIIEIPQAQEAIPEQIEG